jgi:hypothetical protein
MCDMIKDARSQGELIAALRLESLFKAGYLEAAGTKRDGAVRLRRRLEFIQSLAVRAQGLSLKSDMAKIAS